MIRASCHCGAVRFEIAEAPVNVYECNCSICSRLGTLWAYYHPDQVHSSGAVDQTSAYVWGDRTIAFHSCRTCGCSTHWAAIGRENPQRMGVNARLMEGLDRRNTQVKHIDGGSGHFWTASD